MVEFDGLVVCRIHSVNALSIPFTPRSSGRNRESRPVPAADPFTQVILNAAARRHRSCASVQADTKTCEQSQAYVATWFLPRCLAL